MPKRKRVGPQPARRGRRGAVGTGLATAGGAILAAAPAGFGLGYGQTMGAAVGKRHSAKLGLAASRGRGGERGDGRWPIFWHQEGAVAAWAFNDPTWAAGGPYQPPVLLRDVPRRAHARTVQAAAARKARELFGYIPKWKWVQGRDFVVVR